MSEQIVVVGGGVVGAATAQALGGIGHDVVVVDIDPKRRHVLAAQGLAAVAEPDQRVSGAVVLLSVPTPADDAGYDLTALRAASRAVGCCLAGSDSGTIVAVRSTVTPGTATGLVATEISATSGLVAGEGFHVAAAPEFLRQATAGEDAARPWMTVLGCADGPSLHRLEAVFSPLGGALRTFDDPAAAEAVKIAHNCFNAAKISFFNELGAICAAVGIDGDAVAEVVVRSAEASRNPDYGTRGGRPFGGACLPKDLNGLIAYASDVGVDPEMLRAVRAVNRSMSGEA